MAESNKFKKDLLKRSISGLVIASIILIGVALGGIFWNMVAILIGLVSLREYLKIISIRLKTSVNLGVIIGAIFLTAASFKSHPYILLGLISLSSILILAFEISRRQISGVSTAIENCSGILSGLVYIILPWSFSIFLRNGPSGGVILLSLFTCTWSCDVFAYLVGSKYGRHKLCNQISPNKTWEGFCSGLAGSFLTASLISYFYAFPPLPIMIIGLVCGIAGQIGDLEESLIKREGKVKDSSSIIPGHGGMLDRFDSILVSMTVVFIIFEVIWR